MKPIQMTIEVDNPVFHRADVLVVVGTHDYWRKTLNTYGFPPALIAKVAGDEYAGRAFDVYDGSKLEGLGMLLPPCDWSIDFFRTLSHEVSHIVDYCIDLHELKLDPVHNEVRARLNEFYYARIAAALRGLKPCTFKQRHFNYKGRYLNKKEKK